MCTGSAEDAISSFLPAADKTALRRLARQRRRAIPTQSRNDAQRAVAAHLLSALDRHRWQRVAAYAAVASELDLASFFAAADATLAIHLPVVAPPDAMHFRRWHAGAVLDAGAHGIPQPSPLAAEVSVACLDAVLLPLLAYDDNGTRLGSGAGYYDRALAFRRGRATPPVLVGVAFAAQRFDALPREPWDIPLDAIVTEHGWRDFRTPTI